VVKPKEEEILEDEELLEDLEDEEEEEEEAKVKPATRRRRRRKVVEEPPDDDFEDEKEDEPTPKKTRRRTRKKVVEPEPEPVKADVSDLDVFYGLLESLDEGHTLVVSRTGEDTWSVSSSGTAAVVAGPQKLKGQAYWMKVLSPEFLEFDEEWKELTFAEKKVKAKKAKARWEAHEDDRVEAMRVKPALMKKLGIEKYKPEYQTRAARAAIKG